MADAVAAETTADINEPNKEDEDELEQPDVGEQAFQSVALEREKVTHKVQN